MFTATGMFKITQTKEWLAGHVEWVKPYPPGLIKAIGGYELVCVAGLAAPLISRRIRTTPVATAAILADMTVAALVHLRISEYGFIALNAALFVAAAVLGRASLRPPRS